MDDHELLQTFAAGNHDAFAMLAKRYVNLVHACSLRLCADPQDAQDVCQAVFVLLSRKAAAISRNVILSGWLLRATRFAASELRRAQRRREYHERNAAMTRTERQPEESDTGEQMLPLLDQALAALSEQSRAVLLLRYFEGRDYPETAQRLGISETAARQRVSRAIEQLRDIFVRKGIHVPAATIGTTLAAQATLAAPPAVLEAAAAAPLAGGPAEALASATQSALTAGSIKAIAAVLLGWIAIGSAALVLMPLLIPTPKPIVITTPAAPPRPPANPPRPRSGPRTVLPRPAYGFGGEHIDASGVVHAADGSPLAGAIVHLATPRRPLWLYWRQYFGGLKQTTPDTGTYSFPPVEDSSFAIVVTHTTGIGVLNAADVKAGRQVVLRPWASVQGTLLADGRPLPKARVHLSNWRITSTVYSNLIIQDYGTNTDEDGRFAFPQVAPGEVWLNYELPGGGHCAYKRLIVTSGESASVTLGDTGRSLTGKVIATTQPADWTVDSAHRYRASLIATGTASPLPPVLPDETAEQTDARLVQWEQSEEGMRRKLAQFSHSLRIGPDGALLGVAIPPGSYTLVIQRMVLDQETRAWSVAESAQRPLTIDAGSSSQDVGEIQLTPAAPVNEPSTRRLR